MRNQEDICKRAGIEVTYCAEQCGDDSASVSTILRAIKRSMADEYKRELSVRIDKASDMPPSPS